MNICMIYVIYMKYLIYKQIYHKCDICDIYDINIYIYDIRDKYGTYDTCEMLYTSDIHIYDIHDINCIFVNIYEIYVIQLFNM